MTLDEFIESRNLQLQSTYKGCSERGFKWLCTITGKGTLVVDYTTGFGHCDLKFWGLSEVRPQSKGIPFERLATMIRCGFNRPRTSVADMEDGVAVLRLPVLSVLLECLQWDCNRGQISFEKFCLDYGLEEDSRRAFADHEACKAMCLKCLNFFGPDFHVFMDAREE